MMDSLLGLKHRHNEHNTVHNLDHATPENYHRSLKSNITSLYGGDTWKEICLLEIIRIKTERRTADLQFRNKKYKFIYTQVERHFSRRTILHILSNLVLMMDPIWGLKCQQYEQNTMDNLDHATPKNYHKSLKSNINSLYGGDTWKEICLLEISRIKTEKGIANLQFRNKKYKFIYS